MYKNDVSKAYCCAVMFSILVGFSFLGIKTCVPYADSLHILVHRFNFALLALVLLVIFKVIKLELRGKPKKDLIITAAFYIGFMLFQVVGLYYATSIEGSIIFAIVPIMVQIIAAVFLGEKTTMSQNIFVFISVAALIVMVIMGSTEISFSPIGIILLLISSFLMALNNVYTRYVRNQYKPIEITAAIIIGGTVVFNLLFFLNGFISPDQRGYFEPFQNVEFIVATFYLGVGCILLSAQMMAYMQSKMQSAKASVFGNVSTAISIVAGAVILGEPLYTYHIICTVLIIAGAIGLNFFGKKGVKNEVRIPDGK